MALTSRSLESYTTLAFPSGAMRYRSPLPSVPASRLPEPSKARETTCISSLSKKTSPFPFEEMR